MTALLGLSDPERRQGLVAFGVRVDQVSSFPPAARLVVSLDGTEALHPFEVLLTPAQHTRLLPLRGAYLVAVIGPREDFGGLAGIDVDLAGLARAEGRSTGTATFRVWLGERHATEPMVVPTTIAELAQLGTLFGRPARITLGTLEESGDGERM